MNPILALFLLSAAAFWLGHQFKGRPRRLKIGQRITRMRRTKRGRYRRVECFVSLIIEPMIRLTEIEGGKSVWIRRERIKR